MSDWNCYLMYENTVYLYRYSQRLDLKLKSLRGSQFTGTLTWAQLNTYDWKSSTAAQQPCAVGLNLDRPPRFHYILDKQICSASTRFPGTGACKQDTNQYFRDVRPPTVFCQPSTTRSAAEPLPWLLGLSQPNHLLQPSDLLGGRSLLRALLA